MDITTLSGIGEKRAYALRAVGINTIYDAINHFPRDYDDRSQIKTVAELIPDAVNTIRGAIIGEPENINPSRKAPGRRPLTLTKAVLKDASGSLELIWYNQPYLKKYFKKEQEYTFTGRVRIQFNNRVQMESPDYEPCGDTQLSGGRIVPVYTTPKGFSQKTFRVLISQAIGLVSESEICDNLPITIRQTHKLCDRKTALLNIHFPESNHAFMEARRRLVFEELFFMQMALLTLKRASSKQSSVVLTDMDLEPLITILPFAPTMAQFRVLEDIKADYTSGIRMNRLIQGDVGSGKTAVAMAAAYLAIKNGYQSAIMAPTEVLAQQHFIDFSRYMQPLGIETVLLTGSQGAKARREALAKIACEQNLMIVGTHALIQPGVEFLRLGLVITDEQHRFGVNQRFRLALKGQAEVLEQDEIVSTKGDTSADDLGVHTLVMTATPIPRTLALILYGDLDISIINELPPGRKSVKTYCVNSSYKQRLHAFIQKETDAGRQAYIICPAIEESTLVNEENDENAIKGDSKALFEAGVEQVSYSNPMNLNNVLTYTKELSSALPDISISFLHGKMKPAEKQEIMDKFKAGSIQVLVSTTVIEVGVHVENANLMIIENAERFGLSQLHQLRGRVGRGNAQAYCVLITDAKNKITKTRMKAMTDTTDGFKLAELDLAQRGAGDFFGTRQHGLPDFTIANLYRDMDILKIAQSAAHGVHNGEIVLSDVDMDMVANKVALAPIL